ncbi:MAG: hypothetical protein IJ015_06575 [Ruminococcus sp.]|nr:hypothetical protein [Ruminococcus sp.]
MKKLISLLLVIAVMLSTSVLSAFAISPILYDYGDVNKNGAVEVVDATLIQQHLAKLTYLTDLQFQLCDVNDDGEVNIFDASFVQQYVAKIITELPRDPISVLSVVDIKAVTRSIPDSKAVVGEEISFTVHADLNFKEDENSNLAYAFELKGITHPKIQYTEKSDSNVFSYTFPEAGTYRIVAKAYDKVYDGYDESYIVYEVAESYPYDSDFVYVEYEDKISEYALNSKPTKPENSDIDYSMLHSQSTIYNISTMTYADCYDFACVIDTKEQYDVIFKFDNDAYDDKFFEENSLVAIVSYTSCHEAKGALDCVCVENDTLYIDVNEYLPDPELGVSPTEPCCILIAKVSKSDVESVTDIDWL